MSFYCRIKYINVSIAILMYLACGLFICAKAQGIHRVCERGVEVSYGLHHFVHENNENTLIGFGPMSRGISLGYVMGNNLVKGRIRGLGIYEATNHQFQMYEGETLLNFYLLEFVRTRQNVLDIYLLAGLNFSHLVRGYKSTGTYRTENSINQQVGIGLEYLLRSEKKITYLFAELNAGTPFKFEEHRTDAGNVLPAIRTSINIGIRYAFRKPGTKTSRF